MIHEKKQIKMFLLAGIISIFAFLFACTNPASVDKEGIGQVKFGIAGSSANLSISKSISVGPIQKMNAISDAASLLVTIENSQGVVYNLKKLALYNFNGSYISEPLSLKKGTYQITDYIVLDASDNIIFVTPKAGSDKAYLVQNPLPISFDVQKDSTATVMPEIISVDSSTPEEFGYTTFGFNVTNTFDFKTSALVSSGGNFVLTTCNISISNGAVTLYDASLDATVNTITLNDLSGDYVITATKQGYQNYSITFSNAEMKTYQSAPYSIILKDLYLNPSMIFIQNGTFNMGAVGCTTAVHSVTLDSFYIGKYEVTYTLWSQVRTWAISHGYTFVNDGVQGNDGGINTTDQHPVTNANWYDVIKWCNALSERNGLTPCYYTDDAHSIIYRTGEIDITNSSVLWTANGFRIPTAAEWEYAARNKGNRSGLEYSGSNIADDIAWYSSNSNDNTHPIGQKNANELGIYDMSGNVWEWCWDWHALPYSPDAQINPRGPESGTKRVDRGGGWSHTSVDLRTATHFGTPPTMPSPILGFRLVRVY